MIYHTDQTIEKNRVEDSAAEVEA